MSRRVWTPDEVRALGVRTDLVTACNAVLDVGKTKAWEMYHAGELPFPAIRCGRRVVVPVAPLLTLLGISADTTEVEALASKRALTLVNGTGADQPAEAPAA
jgi:hypothetical protein